MRKDGTKLQNYSGLSLILSPLTWLRFHPLHPSFPSVSRSPSSHTTSPPKPPLLNITCFLLFNHLNRHSFMQFTAVCHAQVRSEKILKARVKQSMHAITTTKSLEHCARRENTRNTPAKPLISKCDKEFLHKHKSRVHTICAQCLILITSQLNWDQRIVL